jgi:hypothetical protein
MGTFVEQVLKDPFNEHSEGVLQALVDGTRGPGTNS